MERVTGNLGLVASNVGLLTGNFGPVTGRVRYVARNTYRSHIKRHTKGHVSEHVSVHLVACASFSSFGPVEISVVVQFTLRHHHHHQTDVLLLPDSTLDSVVPHTTMINRSHFESNIFAVMRVFWLTEHVKC